MPRALTHPPFDPELAPLLSQLPVSSTTMTPDLIAEVRQQMETHRPARSDLEREGAVRVEERTVSGPAGAPDIGLLILSPTESSHHRPGLYHTHGGGMVSGDRYVMADLLAEWVEEFGVVAVSVDYRLAPEHRYPAPVEDCYAGLEWVHDHAEELGIDRDRIMVLGASAGGGLAAATALLARDRGGPALLHQILLYPMLDDRAQTPSSQELDGEGMFDRTSNHTGWAALLGEQAGGPEVSPYAAPARAEDLSGLPPTYIDVGQVETFRDEAIIYAARLSQAGVPVELHVWPGAYHAFDAMMPQAAVSQAAIQTRRGALHRILG